MKPSKPQRINRRLSDAEQDRLTRFLSANRAALDFEGLDGFFGALIAGPELVMPSEYLPVVWGGELPADAFQSVEQANEILQLMMRHWNTIASSLEENGVYVPVVRERDDGRPRGESWARGFMRGVDLRRASWSPLVENEDECGALLPIALMAGEVDPAWPKTPLSEEQQDDRHTTMGAGLLRIYRYFLQHRRVAPPARAGAAAYRREAPKTGRNDPCPCRSGRKYKHCCGASGAPRSNH